MRSIPRRRLLPLLSILIASPLLLADDTNPPVPPHLALAQQMVQEIKPADNAYVYHDPFIRFKGDAGADRFVSHADCSSFFDLLIEHVYHLAPQQLHSMTGHGIPTAAAWYDAVIAGAAAPLLTRIPQLTDAIPGDAIFIKYAPGEKDTGHVMLLAAAPTPRDATAPLEPGTQQWAVKVIDSSKSYHGPTDTRRQTSDTVHGLGEGVFRLYTHADHTLAGYAWSTAADSKFVPISEHAIVLAHVHVP